MRKNKCITQHTKGYKHTFLTHSSTLAALLSFCGESLHFLEFFFPLFSLKWELKRRWGLFFFFFGFQPSDEFMHLKRSFVTRELALHPCTLCSSRQSLHHLRLRELGRGHKNTKKKEKGILACLQM